MGEVLAELEAVLRSNRKEKITLEEELFLQKCKVRAVNGFLVTGGCSSALLWGAARNLNRGARVSLSLCTAVALGGWRFDRSLKLCLNHILAAEGSRMQRELANILLAKNHDNHTRPPILDKYLYPEQVFSDTNPDKPVTRWRLRSFYEDGVAAHRTDDISHHHEKPHSEAKNNTRSGGEAFADQVYVNADPLDVILGYPGGGSPEISLSKTMGPSPPSRRSRAHNRAHRRSRRAMSPDHTISNVEA